jgi:hypothetical protein
MRFCLGKVYTIGTMQSLMSKEDIDKYIESMVSTSDKILFSYYAKKKISVDPIQVIPEKLMAVSDLVVWMDLFSTDWKVLKDTAGIAPTYNDRWKKNIEKYNFSSAS